MGSKVSGVAVGCDDLRLVGRRWLTAASREGELEEATTGAATIDRMEAYVICVGV